MASGLPPDGEKEFSRASNSFEFPQLLLQQLTQQSLQLYRL